MSANASFWAWEQPLKASEKLTLLALAHCENKLTKQCNPSVSRLVKMTGLNRKTVLRSLVKLQDLGLIERSKKYGSSNNYTLKTSTYIGTTDNATSTKTGTAPVPFSGLVPILPPVPFLGLHQYQNWDLTSAKFGTLTYKEHEKNIKGGGKPSPPPPDEKFTMNDDWMPDDMFGDQCLAARIYLKKIPSNQIAQILVEFKSYWANDSPQKKFTHGQWQHKLLRNFIFENQKGDLYDEKRYRTEQQRLSDFASNIYDYDKATDF